MPEGRLYFFDSVTLSNFALAGRFDLVLLRYGRRATLTTAVLDELADGLAAGYSRLSAVFEALRKRQAAEASLRIPEREAFRDLLRTLGAGEASCIACAQARRGVVVTDDRAARACCADRNVACTGTVGILVACAKDGELRPGEADALLADMVRNGFYSPVGRISDLL